MSRNRPGESKPPGGGGGYSTERPIASATPLFWAVRQPVLLTADGTCCDSKPPAPPKANPTPCISPFRHRDRFGDALGSTCGRGERKGLSSTSANVLIPPAAVTRSVPLCISARERSKVLDVSSCEVRVVSRHEHPRDFSLCQLRSAGTHLGAGPPSPGSHPFEQTRAALGGAACAGPAVV